MPMKQNSFLGYRKEKNLVATAKKTREQKSDKDKGIENTNRREVSTKATAKIRPQVAETPDWEPLV